MIAKDLHWMIYREFGIFDDSTSAELMWIRDRSRKMIEEARSALLPHGIHIAESRVENSMFDDYRGTCLRLVLGFSTAEDLAMARLLLDPN